MVDTESGMELIARFSEQYRKEYLFADDEPGKDDGPFGLTFFLKRAFAGGRNDELAGRYRQAAEVVLEDRESDIRNRIQGDGSVTDLGLLEDLEESGGGNKYDRQMVVDILNFLQKIPECDHDMFKYVGRQVEANDLQSAFERLQCIYNIGPKKTALFLRDAVTLFGLEDEVESDEYRYLVPVDTWVHRVSKELDIVETDSADWSQNSDAIVDACSGTVSPVAFDQGAWYLGANAFDVLMENLPRIEEFD